MTSASIRRIGAYLASALIVFPGAGLASDDASSSKGLASILIEGASATATYYIDGRAVKLLGAATATRPLVIKAGRHVIEVREDEDVTLREEVVLEPGETRTLRVNGAKPE